MFLSVYETISLRVVWTRGLLLTSKVLKFHTVERHVVCDKPLRDSLTCKHIFHCHDNCFTILTGGASYIVHYEKVVSPFVVENVRCDYRPGPLRNLLRNQRLSLVASLVLLTGSALGYQIVNSTIDNWPNHCTLARALHSLYPKVCSGYAL